MNLTTDQLEKLLSVLRDKKILIVEICINEALDKIEVSDEKGAVSIDLHEASEGFGDVEVLEISRRKI